MEQEGRLVQQTKREPRDRNFNLFSKYGKID